MLSPGKHVMQNFNLKTELAAAIVAIFREREQESAIREVHRALFECRHSYLQSCSVDHLEILLNSERTARQTELAELAEIQQELLENENNEEIAEVAREWSDADSLPSRVLMAVAPDDEWTLGELQDFIAYLLFELQTDYNAIEEIAALSDAGARCKSYAEYFSEILTDEIRAYLEVTPLLGKDVVPTQEVEEIIRTKCLDLLNDSELGVLARLLGVG